MKWQVLSFSLLASLGVATPILARDGLTVYALRISSNMKELNGKYLTLYNNTVGVHGNDAAAVKVYPTEGQQDSLVQLHTYPVGIVDHALGLTGSDNSGLLAFQDIAQPAATTVPAGTTLDWTSFVLNEKPTTADKPANTLSYARGSTGDAWVAFPDGNKGWTVQWKKGTAYTIETYQLIDIVYETVTTSGGY